MDDESGESMEPMKEVPLIELGEAELERLVRDLVGLLHTDMVYPPKDGHPSRY